MAVAERDLLGSTESRCLTAPLDEARSESPTGRAKDLYSWAILLGERVFGRAPRRVNC